MVTRRGRTIISDYSTRTSCDMTSGQEIVQTEHMYVMFSVISSLLWTSMQGNTLLGLCVSSGNVQEYRATFDLFRTTAGTKYQVALLPRRLHPTGSAFNNQTWSQ
jgi:hypothetical protein